MFSCEICEIFKNTFFLQNTSRGYFSEIKHIHALAATLLHPRIGNLDWNESYEKETEHIHASAADLLHMRIGKISIGTNADIAKAKREK